MKKGKFRYVLSAILVLVLSLGFLAGCGSSETDDQTTTEETTTEETLVGAWDNDTVEMSLVFEDSGDVVVSNLDESYDAVYDWDEGVLNLYIEETDEETTGYLDEDGDLVLEGVNGYFSRVDEAYYVPGTDEDAGELADLDIEGTCWTLSDGTTYHFYDDGTVATEDGVYGTYTWDGQSGTITLDGYSAELVQDEEGFWVLGEDDTYYLFTYSGMANLELLDDDDDGDSYSAPLGAYDNDDESKSFVFSSDGTFVCSDFYSSETGTFECDSDGTIYLYYDNVDTYDMGQYDGYDDTFTIAGESGEYYYVSSAYYTP